MRKIQTRKVSGVVGAIQGGVVSLQATTGLPWWATFAVSSGLVRVILFPLARSRIVIAQDLQRSMPELNALYKMFVRRLSTVPIANVEERSKIISIFFKGVKSSLILHRVNIIGLVAYPIATMVGMITFFYSLRSMIMQDNRVSSSSTSNNNSNSNGGGELGLRDGGAFWFRDLTMPDHTSLLPMLAAAGTYLSIEMSMAATTTAASRSRALTLSRIFKGFFQGGLIIAFPFMSMLPAGIFCYWIPGTTLNMLQTALMRSPAFLKFIRISSVKSNNPMR